MQSKPNENTGQTAHPLKVAFQQAEQVVAQIKVTTQQNQVNLEALRNLLVLLHTRTNDLENSLRISHEKHQTVFEKFNLCQKELQKADVKIRELEKQTEHYKRSLHEAQMHNNRILEQSKAEATKTQMMKQTFENYVDYAAKAAAEKLKETELESKSLKTQLNQKDEQLKKAITQTQENQLTIQTLARREHDYQHQIKKLAEEKTSNQRNFEQKLQQLEEALIQERTLRKSVQDRIIPLEQEINELRGLNDSLKNTLKLDQPRAAENQADTVIKTEESPPPSHRIEETSDGAVLVWN